MDARAATPREIVGRFLSAMEKKDYAAGLPFVAPDCAYTNVPLRTTVHGPEGVRAVLEPFFAPTLDNVFEVLREATQGDVVILERLDKHQLADRWVELQVVGVFVVRDGLIATWNDYFDAQMLFSAWPELLAGQTG